MTIDHNLNLPAQPNILILVPFGLHVHEWIATAKEGDRVEGYDGIGKFVSASVISTDTAYANTMSLAIYGLPIDSVMSAMKGNYRDRIWHDRVFLVTLRKM